MEQDLEIDLTKTELAPKNTRGQLGKICNNCGGFGFTLSFGKDSNSNGCQRCDQTGVEPVDTHELQRQFIELSKQVVELKEIIIKHNNE
jgi:hypothetical protein